MDNFDLVNRRIDHYKIVKVIGSGGMGTVYKARDDQLERSVAIKFLNPNLLRHYSSIEQFKKEAIHQARLSHPNITTVHGLVEHKSKIGIVFEYIRGNSLSRLLKREGRLNLNDALYIIKQVLSGTGYAHAMGFIHRDIKPSNIMLGNNGQIKLLDFGISKNLDDHITLTRSAGMVGTVQYMSPEQIRGENVSPQTDIYSIGCTLYEMLTGFPPFSQGTEFEIMNAHLQYRHRRLYEIGLSVPETIDQILDKSLAKETYNRYFSCEDFIYDLRNIEKVSHYINLDTASDSIRQPEKRSGFRSFLIFLFILVFLLAALFFSYKYINSVIRGDGPSDKNDIEFDLEF